jgi:hypothetical protein
MAVTRETSRIYRVLKGHSYRPYYTSKERSIYALSNNAIGLFVRGLCAKFWTSEVTTGQLH